MKFTAKPEVGKVPGSAAGQSLRTETVQGTDSITLPDLQQMKCETPATREYSGKVDFRNLFRRSSAPASRAAYASEHTLWGH